MTASRPQHPTRLLLAVAFALVATLTPLTAAARPAVRTPDQQREMLVRLLGDTGLKLDKRILVLVGDDVGHQLLLIADLPGIASTVRVRALAALAYYPSATTQRYLTGMLSERSLHGTDLGTRLRQQALRSLGVGFGAAAVADILTQQRDREPLIRQAVADALRDASDPSVLPVLEQWLGREPELFVRAAIDAAISSLRGR